MKFFQLEAGRGVTDRRDWRLLDCFKLGDNGIGGVFRKKWMAIFLTP